MGKTRLALRLASDFVDSVADGVRLVELAALQDPALVAHAIGLVVDVRERPGEPVQVTLCEAFRARDLLLVVDNCEHLAAPCAELVNDLLRGCPRLRVVATSRQPLGVAGETIWRVPSLAVPDSRVATGTDEITASEAVRLFYRPGALQP